MLRFILEIGTEELPARFLAGLEKELAERFTAALDKEGVEHADIATASTPRRAVVRASLAPASIRRTELVMGPPVKVAYDAEGKFTKAADGFARTQGVDASDLFTEKTDKGEYLALRKKSGGEDSAAILARLCPEIISALSFPKRMRWGDSPFTYARPLRWILALLGDTPVRFEAGGVSSGNQTWGHRIHGPGPLTLTHAADYDVLIADKAKVTVDGTARSAAVVTGGNALAEAVRGRILWKESLLHEVAGLTEHPVPLLGGFDPSFLEIPREVLLTSMESHQKSFGLEGSDGKLLPYFLTVLNMTPPDEALVRKGWERVLRARLEDARFFWKTDLAQSFDNWLASLDSVIFLAPLGSMGDKTRRLEALCRYLAEQTGGMDLAGAARAGRLSKADLVSGMVGEFDTLQGIMGGIYAEKRGETATVSQARREQYQPAGPDTPAPASGGGALLSLADKADTLAGCFGLGMVPTGTVDPYALRRCALGIARIILEHNLDLDLRELFRKARDLYGERNWKLGADEALAKLMEFFTLRLKNLFMGQGTATLLVEAALGSSVRDARRAKARLDALAAFSITDEFSPAVMTFKRVANIVRKEEQDKGPLAPAYDAALLAEDAEKSLAAALERVAPRFDALWDEDNYADLLGLLGELRPVVDAFFGAVMVMVDDAALRRNRLGLLKALEERFGRLADFTALQM